jgi:hypothetical protein
MKSETAWSPRKGRGARVATLAIAIALGLNAAMALAADWSDTSIGWRYGTRFAEPFETNDISKNIVDFQHVSGYKYGVNFFNVDLLMSDSKDAAACPNFNCTGDAQEAYVVYRNNIEWGKVSGTPAKFPGVRDLALTLGFDWNAKTDSGYNSKKRMLVWGPTAEIDVPGFLNVGVLGLNESNAPCTTFPPPAVGYPPSGCVSRYTYKTHPMLSTSWGIPIGSWPVSYEGFFLWIASKGTNEFGGPTKPEINWDSEIMLDVGRVVGGPKGVFKVGFEYQYWKNKFGNDYKGIAGPGAFAKTPMIRAEYHF